MKKVFLLLFVLAGNIASAQTDYESIILVDASDYAPANKYALEASNYALSVPYDKNNQQRTDALRFIIKWMSGTPDFSFELDQIVMEKVVGENDAMLGLYMACMAKYCLENEANAKNNELVRLNAIKLLIAYCEKPENNIKMAKPFKKLVEANKKGQLESALK